MVRRCFFERTYTALLQGCLIVTVHVLYTAPAVFMPHSDCGRVAIVAIRIATIAGS